MPNAKTTQPEPQSVGKVAPQTFHFDEPLLLACGRSLQTYDIVAESYGELNEDKSNAILICHALSGHHHAAGYHADEDKKPGWWDHYVGPGKPLDTNKFFIICPNNIGGCHGSTGPTSVNPETGKPWGASFPHIRVRDWVHSQARLADLLGIQQWAAVVGGSLGGMQAMRWSLEYPERLRHCVVIASSMKLTAQNIAFNETARQAIQSDPEFRAGGSGTFEQGTESPVEFQIESYLRYQAEHFSKVFDANTYILMTKALDYFDLAREYEDDAANAFSRAQCKFLVMSFTSDWRFAPERSQEIVSALMKADKDVVYAEIESQYGHDAFLVANQPRYWNLFQSYMNKVASDAT